MHQVCAHISDGLNKLVWEVSGRSWRTHTGLLQKFQLHHKSALCNHHAASTLRFTKQFNLFLMCQQYHGKTKPTRAPVKGGLCFLLVAWWSLQPTCTPPSAVWLEHGGMDAQTRPPELKSAALHQEKPLNQQICELLCGGWCSALPCFCFRPSSPYSVMRRVWRPAGTHTCSHQAGTLRPSRSDESFIFQLDLWTEILFLAFLVAISRVLDCFLLSDRRIPKSLYTRETFIKINDI